MRDAKARRVVEAVLARLDGFCEQAAEIERYALPGNRIRALRLQREIVQLKVELEHLAKGVGKT